MGKAALRSSFLQASTRFDRFSLSTNKVGCLVNFGPKGTCDFPHERFMHTSNAGQVRRIFSIQPQEDGRGYFTSLNKPTDCRSLFATCMGRIRSFSEDVTRMPFPKDPEIRYVFKDLMAANWNELPNIVTKDAKKALSKNTDDKVGQEILTNVLRAAEAVEEFGGRLVSLRMEIDDSIGISGEDVKPLSDEFKNALRAAYERYSAYLDAFGPDEVYLKKKVETELGTMMIHLKMRCSGLGSEWGKVTVLGTSGISGSYVEQRAA